MLSFKKIIFSFCLFVLAGFVMGRASVAFAATFEEQVVSLINSERAKQNLPQLAYSSKLFGASLAHNNTMFSCAKVNGVNSCFVHQVAGEAKLIDRIKAMGYNPQAVAENIAWGHTTPSSVVAGWMGSSGHRANILGTYKDVGCDYLNALNGSYQGMYWTCDFGKSFSSSSSTPTPTQKPSPTPTSRPSSTPSPTSIKPSPTNSPTNGPTATPTPASSNPAPGSPAWWCKYAPRTIFCP